MRLVPHPQAPGGGRGMTLVPHSQAPGGGRGNETHSQAPGGGRGMRLVHLLVKADYMHCISTTQLSWLLRSGNKRRGNLASYPGPVALTIHKKVPEYETNERGTFYNWHGWDSGVGFW